MSRVISIRRWAEEKELRMAGELVGTKEELEHRGMTYMGSVGVAAECGYLTPRACENTGRPVTPEERKHPGHFAMLTSCYSDLCIIDGSTGKRKRPCIPVFFRREGPKRHVSHV